MDTNFGNIQVGVPHMCGFYVKTFHVIFLGIAKL